MRFWRKARWTFWTCSFVLKAAARVPVQTLLPPLLTLTAYPLLLLAALPVPLAFVIAHSLGYALLVWLVMQGAVERLAKRRWPAWAFPAIHLVIIATVLWLESPAAALRIMYLFIFLRIFMLLLDLSTDDPAIVRNFWPQPEMRPHDDALTRMLLLRDVAMILLGETVIFTGSVPLMLALLAFWQVLNGFIDRAVVTSVLLVRQDATDR
jgi:hypothetical protein